jgi:hypothetical protein
MGSLGSNGDVILSNNIKVGGDISTSLDDGITIGNSATFSGDSTSSAPENDIEFVPDSEFDWAKSVNGAPSGFTGTYDYSSATGELKMKNNDTLVLSSGVYYFSTLTIDNSSSLQIAPGAEVTMYLTDGLHIRNSSSLNPGGPAANLIIYSKGTLFDVGNTVEFQAGFVGPYTDIVMDNNTEFYGGFVGKSVQIVNSACAHFDRSLSKIIRDEVVGYRKAAWVEL